MSNMSSYPYPGVYVEEKVGLALSVVSGETAVPAFVCADATVEHFGAFPRVVNSWLDVPDDVTANTIGYSLRAYFENGGGYCYVVKASEIPRVPELDDVTLLVQAGELTAGAAMLQICNKTTGIFGLFDVEIHSDGIEKYAEGEASRNLEAVLASGSAFVAIYGPRLMLNNDPAGHWVSPSAAVAGVYCTVDRERGVWKAPANVAIRGRGLKLTFEVSNKLQGELNKIGDNGAVNVIRSFGDGVPIVWGARTANGASNEWRYVSTRRLFNAIEKDIKRAMSFAVFEPNSAPTWERVRAAVDSYLYVLWREGGLVGAKPEEAYSVLIGKDVTMTEEQIKNGKMILQVGVAASRPAEFIILEFSQEVGAGSV